MPTVYRDTDPSAPVLTGQVGSLIALLDACLVNGYTGKTAAGWSKPYTGGTPANQAVYLQGGSAPNRYFQVDDNAAHVTALAREARVAPFETMSAYGTGTGNISSGGNYTAGTPNYTIIRKSNTADATVRQWLLVADQKTFYLWIQTGDTAVTWIGSWFGDFWSYKPGDNFKAGGGGRVENSASTTVFDPTFGIAISSSLTGAASAFRSHTGVAGSVLLGASGDSVFYPAGSSLAGSAMYGILGYPHSPDGGFYLSPVYLWTGTTTGVRGKHRGIWHGVHPLASFSDGNVIVGTGAYAGRSFMIVAPSGILSPGVAQGYAVVEITAGQWPASS